MPTYLTTFLGHFSGARDSSPLVCVQAASRGVRRDKIKLGRSIFRERHKTEHLQKFYQIFQAYISYMYHQVQH